MKVKKIIAVFILLVLVIISGVAAVFLLHHKKGNKSQMEELSSKLTPYEELLYDGNFYRTCYEVFVYSFADGNADGIGDICGLTDNLNYIRSVERDDKEGLGCTELWLMPIFPSPTYHKYDVTDYMNVDKEYGTMNDFTTLLDKCHGRGIKVILDLPLNHTSVEHPWFMEAADYLRNLKSGEKPDSKVCKYIDYYNFSHEPADGYEKLTDNWYYEARFWSGMPDLNLDNEDVRNEIEVILRFWIEKGVDGFRLDAVTSYYSEDKNRNIEFTKWINDKAKEINNKTYIVGEAWADQKIYSEYYKSGADSFFDFRFSGPDGVIASTVKGVKRPSYFGEALQEEEELYSEMSDGKAINAPFYTNHDMARSAGYYLEEDMVKQAGALNLLVTGNAFIYYGEELGMRGSGKDENKRTAFPWVGEDGGEKGITNCKGPKDASKQELTYGSLEDQKKDKYSIYNYYKNAIRIRNAFPAISKGRTTVIEDKTTDSVLTFKRALADTPDLGDVLIVINFSSEDQTVEMAGLEEYGNLSAVLTVSEKRVKFNKKELKIPARGIAFLTR
ncbi:alpha-amylase family glycosyl hydrolase [Eubacterium sp.]|uniref:alpha-amylase family glycosyl hydrolase n=1 Tax=Eubacterium sp. TaxID=142586 RepID=UPI00258B9A37|nr:alpha-amylase family glycosyl hydrolase [Eubacterium sp.]MCR5368994.1 alpha-amylase [Eubacterium sp.]